MSEKKETRIETDRNREFREHIAFTNRVIDSWPEWKQRLVGKVNEPKGPNSVQPLHGKSSH